MELESPAQVHKSRALPLQFWTQTVPVIVTEKCHNLSSFFQGEEPAHGDQLLHNVAGGGRLPRRPRRHAVLSRIRGHGPGG